MRRDEMRRDEKKKSDDAAFFHASWIFLDDHGVKISWL